MVHLSYGPGYLWATTKSFWSSTHMGHILSELRVDISMGSNRVKGRGRV